MAEQDRYLEMKRILDEIKSQEDAFVLTENHIRMFRRMIVVWDASESGAPVVQIYQPPGALAELAGMIGITLKNDFLADGPDDRRFEFDVGAAFEIFLHYGHLDEGNYTYDNPFLQMEIETWPVDAHSDRTLTLPQGKTIDFEFIRSHARLLKAANAGWLDYLQRPGINSKRPYGDRVYYEEDMARVLGLDQKGVDIDDLSDEQLKMLQDLHVEMLYALQVYLKFGSIAPGIYCRKGYGMWVPQ
jgi:hypothetical protein